MRCFVSFCHGYIWEFSYLMYYRKPGFLTVVWFGSCPTPPFPLSRQQVVSFFSVSCVLAGPAYGEGWGRSQIIRRRESLFLYNTLTTLCIWQSSSNRFMEQESVSNNTLLSVVRTGWALTSPPPPLSALLVCLLSVWLLGGDRAKFEWSFFIFAVLRTRIRDPGSGAFLTPGPGSGIRDPE
jgi:hypothetical protein